MNYALHDRVMRSMIPRVGQTRTDEFGKDAVQIAVQIGLSSGLSSGLTGKQVADDPGIGMSTLNQWITAHPLPAVRVCMHERGRPQSRFSGDPAL